MRYIVEVSQFAEALLSELSAQWQFYDEADSLFEAKLLAEAAEREHPNRRVRVRQERVRADIDG
jgi:hypothetical protein